MFKRLSKTLFYYILCIYVLCCNFNQLIGKFLCPHTETIKTMYFVFYSVGKHGKHTLASSGVTFNFHTDQY